MAKLSALWGIACLVLARTTTAIDVDWNDEASIKLAASRVAYGMMTYYHGNLTGGTPGLLDWPAYYWWEAGGMFGTLIDYWHYTGDTTYNQVVMDALQFQVGSDDNYEPQNQTFSLGNDDQAFWGMAALAAAEYNFPNPPAKDPSWLTLAMAVYNRQINRWDNTTCNGGIHWQIFPANGGYPLKNTISNGCLFNIASRLARYTGDDKYAQWAVRLWDWMYRIGLIDENYNVYDNSEADVNNCTQVDHTQWSYNAATLLMGAAAMYNYTNGTELWKTRVDGLLDTMTYDYFPGGIMKDICEEYAACNTDQKSFKAYVARWMSQTSLLVPYTYDNISALMLSSAKGAATQCTGGTSGEECGVRWYNGTWDGTFGVGQQMSALAVIQGTLVKQNNPSQAPLTNSTGGTSLGDPTAGTNPTVYPWSPGSANKKDKAGAWVLTAFVIALCLFMWFFLSSEVLERGDSTVGGKRKRISKRASGSGMVSAFAGWKGKEKEVDGSNSGNGDSLSPIHSVSPVSPTAVVARRQSGVLAKKSRLSMVTPAPGGEGETAAHGALWGEAGQAGDRASRNVPIYRGGDLAT